VWVGGWVGGLLSCLPCVCVCRTRVHTLVLRMGAAAAAHPHSLRCMITHPRLAATSLQSTTGAACARRRQVHVIVRVCVRARACCHDDCACMHASNAPWHSSCLTAWHNAHTPRGVRGHALT
jgi:hypothetical protein